LFLLKTSKVVYDFAKCTNLLDSMGGSTVHSYQYFAAGASAGIPEAHLVFSENGFEDTDSDQLVNKMVTTRVYAGQQVQIVTHFLDVSTGKPVRDTTVVTCNFGEATDGAVFNISE